ncbi:hypothetical protein Dda_6276 [Drechslerella dactyloides]|uniref:Uncharacterized protein n=1 Tax=Drechslerella dactyloides TaxID=74499 RepID=A0AAD6NIE5_DREDA|nr:hypothetical protein Dda_6276 [Drechslerella dactyloides]
MPEDDSQAIVPSSSNKKQTQDITRSYFLDPSSVRNYDLLTEQLLEDHQRPQKTKVHLDVNLSVDVDLTPATHGDLHLSMLVATVRRKPFEEDVIGSHGRRIAGTVLRISDGGGRLVHRQVVGFESFSEWWWVVRTQLRELIKQKIAEIWQEAKQGRMPRLALLLLLPLAAQSLLLLLWWWWAR